MKDFEGVLGPLGVSFLCDKESRTLDDVLVLKQFEKVLRALVFCA